MSSVRHAVVVQVLGFASRLDAEDWMLAHPEATLGAVHFIVNEVPSPPSIQYTLQTNTTVSHQGQNFGPRLRR